MKDYTAHLSLGGILIFLALIGFLSGCAGKSRIEYWMKNVETNVLEHQATMYAEGKVSGEIDLKNQTGKIDSKTEPFITFPKLEMND